VDPRLYSLPRTEADLVMRITPFDEPEVLPRPLANLTAGIRLVDLGTEPPSRETRIGYHRDLKRLPRLRALLDLILERIALAPA
jgi:DNA-binding transcriptional LysR family regulator